MSFSLRRITRLLQSLSLCLAITAAAADAQVNARPLRPAEQAFLDRLAVEFARILPPLPAGWTEVERKIHDAFGVTSDWEAPIQADYSWSIVRSDIEARQAVVEQRELDSANRNRDSFDAAAARNEKLMTEFSVKLEAAMKKQDQALVDRLQKEFQKQMEAGTRGMTPSGSRAPELSDTDAHIRLSINPYNAPVLEEKRQQAPPGIVWVGRREPDPNASAREGTTRYLIGNWIVDAAGSGHTLKFTPNKGAVVYGIVLEIEARADRADALFRAMSLVRLKALLQ